jgi:hypothetical protein
MGLWALAGSAQAQDGPGSEGPIILQTPASVRFAGLNGAGAALMGHAATVFTNPAGLATIRYIALEGSYQTAPFDAYSTSAAMGWRLRQFDLGFGVQYYDFGSEPVEIPDPSTGGLLGMPTGATVGASEILGVGSLVYRYGLIAIGASGKFVRQDIGDFRDEGASVDLGISIAVFDIMALGFAIQNVGGNWRESSNMVMPRLTRFGFTMNYVDPQGTFRLLSTLEFQWMAGRSSRFVFGGEGGMVVSGVGVTGRLGYGSRPQGSDLAAFTFGATIELNWVDIDFAYEPNDLLDDPTKRIGVRLQL